MLDVLNAAIRSDADRDYYQQNILKALANTDETSDEYDVEQLFEFAEYWARNGDQDARTVIYQKFNAIPALAGFVGAYWIVELDGLQGFTYVAERLGQHILAFGNEFTVGEHRYSLGYDFREVHLDSLEATMGKDVSNAELDRLSKSSTYIAAFLDAIKRPSQTLTVKRPDPAKLSYKELRALIDEGQYVSTLTWGKNASAEDLLQVAQDAMQEENPKRLAHLLRAFQQGIFPLNPEKLFPLTQHSHPQVMAASVAALENISHRAIRQFALKMIAQNYQIGRMIGLLTNNFEPTDWQLIEPLTARQIDPEDYHCLNFSVREVLEQHWMQEAKGSLFNLYEYCPCSMCRYSIVKNLYRLCGVPDWMEEECRHNAYYDLREAMENHFAERS